MGVEERQGEEDTLGDTVGVEEKLPLRLHRLRLGEPLTLGQELPEDDTLGVREGLRVRVPLEDLLGEELGERVPVGLRVGLPLRERDQEGERVPFPPATPVGLAPVLSLPETLGDREVEGDPEPGRRERERVRLEV